MVLFSSFSENALHIVERSAWWLHIIGILVFLNYLYFSKHLHILLAFPNTYFGKLTPKGQFPNNDTVTKEVMLMMDPNADPFAAPETTEGEEEIRPRQELMEAEHRPCSDSAALASERA